MSRGQRIPVRRDTAVAFVGFAPRGPIDIPVSIRSVDEYLKRFGSADHPDRFRYILAQFFNNGGGSAIVVRVCPSSRRCRIFLGGPAGALVLEARNPGPWEYLRASVDYDHINVQHSARFNLIIHRLTSPRSHIVEEQEIFSGVSVDREDADFVGHILMNSHLVGLCGDSPEQPPDSTLSLGIEAGAAYIYADCNWQDAESFTDYDLVGSIADSTGLFALDRVPNLDLVCLIPGSESQDIGPVALFTAERYCRRRNAILLRDPPVSWSSVAEIRKFNRDSDTSSPNVMTYFPRLNPIDGRSEESLSSALGAIAGRLAAEDATYGFGGAPVGDSIMLRCRNRVQENLSEVECKTLVRAGVNPLRELGAGRLSLDGLVTFARGRGYHPNLDDLRKCRLTLFVIDSIIRGTRWAAFEDNAPQIWSEVRQQVEDFLRDLFSQCASVGDVPKNAYYVICDQETNRTGKHGVSPGVTLIAGFELGGGQSVAFRFMQEIKECRVREVFWRPYIALAS